MKFGVVTFPGSNCDQDMIYVLQKLLGQQVETLWHKDTSIKNVDMVILPGGFSYGDYLRSGAIAKYLEPDRCDRLPPSWLSLN